MDTSNSNGVMDTSNSPPDIKPDISQLNVSTSQSHPYAPPSTQPGGGYPHPATSYGALPGVAPPYYGIGQ